MNQYLNGVLTIFKKEFRSEIRTKESFIVMLTFSLLVVILFSMAFEPTKETSKEILPGIMWLGFIFSGVLGLNRSFTNEQRNDCLLGLLSTPIKPFQIYIGKLLSNLLLLVIIEAITFPLYFVFFDLNIQGSIFLLLLIFALGTIGFQIIGTFLAALTSNFRSTESLLPVILFPLLVPVLLAAIEATTAIIDGQMFRQFSMWIQILSLSNIIFLVLSYLLIDFLLEVT